MRATTPSKTRLVPTLQPVAARLETLGQMYGCDWQRAWRWLVDWDAALRRDEIELPPPYSFADETGAMEFEWETPNGDLVLHLPQSGAGAFRYLLTGAAAREEHGEETGSIGIGDVAGLLKRLLV